MERLGLCLKNLGRHGWRTRVILLIAMFGAFVAFVSENVIEDVSRKQSDMFGRASTGHFRIVDSGIEMANTFGYYQCKPEQMLKPGEIFSIRAFLAVLPQVTGSMERIVFGGLLYGKATPSTASTASRWTWPPTTATSPTCITRGARRWRGASPTPARRAGTSTRRRSTSTLARATLPPPNREGEFVDRFITVKGGIDFRTMPKSTMGFRAVYFDLDGFRAAVGYKEALATQVVGFLADARTADRVLPRIASFLAKEHPRLKVVSWREYAPIMAEIVVGFDVMMKSVEAILLLICVLLVVKLTTFSIIERYSEIGTMRALGFTRADITFQFALEGFLIIAAGATAGCLLGTGLIAVLHASGVRNSLTFFEYVIGDGFKPSFHAAKVAAVAAVFAGVAVLAPLFPAIRGGRLSILTTLEKR